MALPRLLLIEDDVLQRVATARLLRSDYSIVETGTAEHALDFILNGHQFDVVLCDLGLHGWSGADLYTRLKRRNDPHASVFVLFSGLDAADRHPRLAAELGRRLARKPLEKPDLLRVLAAAQHPVALERLLA